MTKSYNTICVNSKTWDKIDDLARICNCSKTALLEKIINPLFEIASIYKNANIESYPLLTRGNVIFQFFGESNFIYGKNQPLNEENGNE